MDKLILFRDPLWNSLSAIFAFFAVVVAIAIFFAQRKKKKLSYDVISNTQLLSVKDEIQGKVKVLYEGNEVKKVHLLTLKFTNTGNQPISSTDYERPLTISVNDEATILTYEAIDEEPKNLGAELTLSGNSITLSPLLLNPKDSLLIKALVSDFEGNPEIDGRINGVKSISKNRESLGPVLLLSIISLVLVIFGIALATGKDYNISLFGVVLIKSRIGTVLVFLGYLISIFWIRMLLKVIREIR